MFVNGDRVQFHSTSDAELDTLCGTVVGLASPVYPTGTHFIVKMDIQHSKWPWDCIAITQHCLKKI